MAKKRALGSNLKAKQDEKNRIWERMYKQMEGLSKEYNDIKKKMKEQRKKLADKT